MSVSAAAAPFAGIDPGDYPVPDDVLERAISPALLVYLDHVRANIRRVLELTRGPARWRPHVKTAKIPRVFGLLAEAGVSAFKCATTREADHLLRVLAARPNGAPAGDVLVAYPLVGPALERARALAVAHAPARVSVLCERPEAVEAVPEPLEIFVDVNPGMNRTGVPVADRATILEVARRAGPGFRGVHYYDGHLNQVDSRRRREAALECCGRLVDLLGAFARAGLEVGEVITSGTPTFMDAADLELPAGLPEPGPLHRLSPGTVVYHDARSETLVPGLGLRPAALVLSRVVSHPAAGIVTCDAGSKALATDMGDPVAEVIGHPGLEARRPSEEHLPLAVADGASAPAPGTALLLAPRHVCPTVNLAEEAILIEGGRVAEIVPVSARAHDLWTGRAGAATI